jgi:hypothetical protein
MGQVNRHDHRTFQSVYPENAFASDAAQNEQVSSSIRHGVRIGSAPDIEGWFEVERAARHAGEPETATFLAPARSDQPKPSTAYEQFLDDIIKAAERFGYRADESPGRGDKRIRGQRQ